MTESTALAHRRIPTDEELESIKQHGKEMVAFDREIKRLAKDLAGLTWGSGNQVVLGKNFSTSTLNSLAKFCRITGANELTHIDFLGGKPYLNAAYWTDLLTSHPLFHHYEQRDLSPSVEDEYRKRADDHKAAAEELLQAGIKDEAARHRSKALNYQEKASDIAIARAAWSPRDTATSVIETTIWRFINAAPMDLIREGKVTDLEKYLVPVVECNWAGGMGSTLAHAKKWDPIGDSNPGTTARTRSLKRCATKAFSAWMAPYEAQMEKAERYIEAEFEIIHEAKRTPNALTTGSGEVEATYAEAVMELPNRGEPERPPEVVTTEPEPREPTFDLRDAQKALFATMRDAGIANDERKPWCVARGFPESTKDWTRGDFDQAMEVMIAPWVDSVDADCASLGINLADLSLEVLGKDAPAYLKDYKRLSDVLKLRWEEGVDV